MEFFDRIKTILFNPKEEWAVIEAENEPHEKTLTGYLLILALIPIIGILVGYLLSRDPMFQFKIGIIRAVLQFVMMVGGAYLTAVVIYAISEQFGSDKDFNRTFSLVAYSYTPMGVAGILYFYIPFAWLIPYLGLYGFYILFIGIEPQLKPADEKKTLCFIFSLIAMLAVWAAFFKLSLEIINSIIV